MNRFLMVMTGVVAVATLAVLLYTGKSISKTTNEPSVTETPTNEVDQASYEELVSVDDPTPRRFDKPLPGLAEALAKIGDEDQRDQLESAIHSYRDAVGDYRDAVEALPPSVAEALLTGDEDAVAKAAAKDATIIEQVVTIQERYNTAAKARDAVTVAIAALGSPALAADIYRIVAIIDSDLPDAEKFQKILEIVIQRLLFLMKAMAAAETGSVSRDLIAGVVEDLEVVRGAFTRLVTGGDDGGASSLEAYLPDGSAIEFDLPEDLDLQRLEELVNSSKIEFTIEGGQPTLRAVSPAGELLLEISQPHEGGPAMIVVD